MDLLNMSEYQVMFLPPYCWKIQKRGERETWCKSLSSLKFSFLSLSLSNPRLFNVSCLTHWDQIHFPFFLILLDNNVSVEIPIGVLLCGSRRIFRVEDGELFAWNHLRRRRRLTGRIEWETRTLFQKGTCFPFNLLRILVFNFLISLFRFKQKMEKGFWVFVDMASGKYLWRNLKLMSEKGSKWFRSLPCAES